MKKKIFHANRNQKKAGVAIITSDKIDFKIKTISRDGRTLHNDQGVNPRRRHNNCKYLCTQHRSISVHKRTLTDIKGETDSNTIIVGDFNTPLTPMDRSPNRKLIRKRKS